MGWHYIPDSDKSPEAEALRAKRCIFCDEPIGGHRFYFDGPDEYSHASCVEDMMAEGIPTT